MERELYSELKKEGYSTEDKYFHDLEQQRHQEKQATLSASTQLVSESEKKDADYVEPDPLAKKLHVNTHWVP